MDSIEVLDSTKIVNFLTLFMGHNLSAIERTADSCLHAAYIFNKESSQLVIDSLECVIYISNIGA